MSTVITIWLCLAANPNCKPTDDPTGPPFVATVTAEQCAYEIERHKHMPAPEGYVGHTTCVTGDSI